MSTATITRSARPGTLRPVRRPARRVAPRPARFPGPVARPARGVPVPNGRVRLTSAVRGCRVDAPATAATWRLTDRGIAVVLVLAAMIAVAAVAVVGLTAWRVTGPDYQPASTTAVSAR